jgi:hypothetical protein
MSRFHDIEGRDCVTQNDAHDRNIEILLARVDQLTRRVADLENEISAAGPLEVIESNYCGVRQ